MRADHDPPLNRTTGNLEATFAFQPAEAREALALREAQGERKTIILEVTKNEWNEWNDVLTRRYGLSCPGVTPVV